MKSEKSAKNEKSTFFVNFFAEKFGGKEKMSTFAIPNEKRGNKNLEFGKRSSLKRLITVQEASTEKIQFIEKR